MTTVADLRRNPKRRNIRGQSILEFLITLPVVVGLSVLLIRVNSAIQVGIVNQQYARAQALQLAWNNRSYPNLRLTRGQLINTGYNQMLLGVSNTAKTDEEDTFHPEPPIVGLGSNAPGASDDPGYVTKRNNVRIRTTVTLCAPTYTVRNGSGTLALLDIGPSPGGQFVALGPWKLDEGIAFDYCSAPPTTYGPSG